MLRFLYFVALFVLHTNGDLLAHERSRGATLVLEQYLRRQKVSMVVRSPSFPKPISACCEIPELGDSKPLTECSNPKLPGPCNDVQCVFEKSGFLKDRNTLNKEAYRNHLRTWAEKHKGWHIAIEKAIKDCVDKDLRQYLDYPCRAYDVFTCTGIAMLKKCPEEAWKC